MQDIYEIISAFMDFYGPAESVKAADTLMSTPEIKAHIEELSGEEIEDSTVFDYLEQNGYHYKFTSDGFKWPLTIIPTK